MAAAGIIYFALPPETNPGFVIVLAIFVVSFSLALVSHAPGGLGVLEVTFLTGLSDVPETDVLAALFVFRILYLLIPFAVAIVMVLSFEQSAMRQRAGSAAGITAPRTDRVQRCQRSCHCASPTRQLVGDHRRRPGPPRRAWPDGQSRASSRTSLRRTACGNCSQSFTGMTKAPGPPMTQSL